MNRKPIFDAVRVMLGRAYTQAEVDALDKACDLAEAVLDPSVPLPRPVARALDAPPSPAAGGHVLGSLSEEFESGGRGPGTVSSGVGDPGGVSYGVYQLASKTGTCAAFVKAEGKQWATEFAGKTPGTADFTTAWKAIAAREEQAFRAAQHAFIERMHYRPVTAAVQDRKGLDLDSRHNAVRDATWSCAVQHGKAATILIDAIDATDREADRTDADYDRKLIDSIYDVRITYVLSVAANAKLPQGSRDQLISITRNRYPRERANALAMFGTAAPAGATPAPTPAPAPAAAAESIDGNAVAAANGVAVKSAAVKIGQLHPKMGAVIVAVAEAAKAMGLAQPVITSGNDSNHMNGSLHFKNRALDFRGNNIKVSVGKLLGENVADRLGSDYDVIFETFLQPANNHLHVEFDPA